VTVSLRPAVRAAVDLLIVVDATQLAGLEQIVPRSPASGLLCALTTGGLA
jgi:hypothetical protein